MKKLILVLVTFGIFSGCAEMQSETPESSVSGNAAAPETVKLDANLVSKGEKLFAQMCTGCHQEKGAGKAGLAPRLNTPDFLGLANDAFLKKTILEGRPGTAMMAYKALPDVANNVDSIVAYIRSWQNDFANFKDYNVDWSKQISGNSKSGRTSFRTYCSSCHGPNGGGYADGGSGPGIGLTGFLGAASDDYIRKTIQIGRAGTAMKPFGHSNGLANISDGDINNIVVYLRSLDK